MPKMRRPSPLYKGFRHHSVGLYYGVEALKLFKASQEEISLVLLDVVMPELGGRQVYDTIKVIQPDVRVLFSSGYSKDAIHTGFLLDEGLQLIQKPYSLADLLRRIRRMLDS